MPDEPLSANEQEQPKQGHSDATAESFTLGEHASEHEPTPDNTGQPSQKKHNLHYWLGNLWDNYKFRQLRNDARVWLEIIALGTAIFYTVFAGRTLDQIRKQTPKIAESSDAAKSAADTASSELELSERPWVTAEVKVAGPLYFDKYSGHMKINFSLTNSGHSPAVKGSYGIDFFPTFLRHPEPRDRRDALCNQVIGESIHATVGGASQTWFPGKQPPIEILITMSPQDIQNAMIAIPHSMFPNMREGFPPNIWPVITTCIAYQPSFKNRVYHTAFILDMGWTDLPPPGIFPKIGTIPSRKLLLGEDFVIGTYAN